MTPTKSPSRGEFVSLRDYFESRIQAVEKSIEIANAAMQSRLSGMNEFRDTLKDQAARFVTRDELDVKLDAIKKSLTDLQLDKAKLDGKASQTQAIITMIFAIIGLVLSFVNLFLR